VELDHVFILCDVGAGEEAGALARAGLAEWTPNTHPGQGTACRRFRIGDVYLELVWVHDEAEARSPTAAPTQLFDRWTARRSGGCPFGLIYRPSIDDPDDAMPPFPAWRYAPAYLPPGLAFYIGEATPDEPFVAYMPFARDRARAAGVPAPLVAIERTDTWRLRLTLPDGTVVRWPPTPTA
jgi:hypothetical protein